MKICNTPLGEVRVGSQEELFTTFAALLREVVEQTPYPPGVALTGGSSPKALFRWLAAHDSRLPEAKRDIIFSVSDERHVPIASDESNYGNAERLLLDPLGVTPDHRFPWDTGRTLNEAALWYEKLWSLSFGEGKAYDLCMLGMGDDCHTASLFPGSPLLDLASMDSDHRLFAALEVPGKGGRLTITPRGLEACARIVILVMGEGKADALKRVFDTQPASYSEIPIRLMNRFPGKVVWLVDEPAASGLSL
ncbi:MAG: 6-phosphogluconolactonase [Puniceicoccaceae bacterium]